MKKKYIYFIVIGLTIEESKLMSELLSTLRGKK